MSLDEQAISVARQSLLGKTIDGIIEVERRAYDEGLVPASDDETVVNFDAPSYNTYAVAQREKSDINEKVRHDQT